MALKHWLGYFGLMALGAALTQFGIELGSGNVPLPEALRWTVPIIAAAIPALAMGLPKVKA